VRAPKRPPNPPTPIIADPDRTTRRIEELRAYVQANVLGPTGFCCSHADQCRQSVRPGDRFYEGILSHVGRHYDLVIEGKEVRVVVVGQEAGHRPGSKLKPEHVTLEQRYRAVHDVSGIGRRYYAAPPYPGRNPHMRGTTSVLRLLFGGDLAPEWESEFLLAEGGEGFHIFDAFALVNVLLCSAHPPGSSAGSSTEVMQRNCLEHLMATLRILEPTILILQGRGVKAWLRPAIEAEEKLTPTLARLTIAGRTTLAARFSHPAAHGPLQWGARLDGAYLSDVVEPTVRTLWQHL
jgi:hypothetical protein